MGEKESVCVPSDLLHYVYTFLVRCNYQKAAKALQKATDQTLSSQLPEEPGLLEFYAFYQKRHAGKRTAMSCVDAPVEMPAAKKRKLNEDAQDTAAPAQEKPEMSPSGERRKKKKRSLVGSQTKGKKEEKQENEDVNEDRHSESGHEELLLSSNEPVMESIPAALNGRVLASPPSEAAAEDEDVLPSDKAMLTSTGSGSTGKKSKKRKSGGAVPFKRVADDVSVNPRLQDNSFEAKVNSYGSWGEKANRDLKFTKGKSFRHEKTKKKRGTYKGGAIDTSVCSIKFDSD